MNFNAARGDGAHAGKNRTIEREETVTGIAGINGLVIVVVLHGVSASKQVFVVVI